MCRGPFDRSGSAHESKPKWRVYADQGPVSDPLPRDAKMLKWSDWIVVFIATIPIAALLSRIMSTATVFWGSINAYAAALFQGIGIRTEPFGLPPSWLVVFFCIVALPYGVCALLCHELLQHIRAQQARGFTVQMMTTAASSESIQNRRWRVVRDRFWLAWLRSTALVLALVLFPAILACVVGYALDWALGRWIGEFRGSLRSFLASWGFSVTSPV